MNPFKRINEFNKLVKDVNADTFEQFAKTGGEIIERMKRIEENINIVNDNQVELDKRITALEQKK